MKKIGYLLALFTLLGCEKFLEKYPATNVNEGNFYNTQNDFIQLVNGCYVPMRDYEKIEHWVMAELPSDNASFQYNPVSGEPTRGVIDQFILGQDNSAYARFWELSYIGINRCNKLLTEIDRPGVAWANESIKQRTLGEGLFLRGLYYFNLVRQYGGVPLILTPITATDAVATKRSTEDETYASIIKDLKAALIAFSNTGAVADNGRANEMSASSLLGKVYLTRNQHVDAESALKKVIESGKHSLLPNYANLFNPANKDYKETIFAIQYAETNAELANRFIFYFAPLNSGGAVTSRPNIGISGNAGWNQPTQDLINAFEAGDRRKDVSIGYWNGIPYPNKYKAPISAPDACGDNLPILRYADVLLMYAEALNAQGKTSIAFPYVEQVRTRAGLLTPSGLDKAALESLIAKERQVELCFENNRWYDLKRTGKAISVMTAHGTREKALKNYLFPNAYQMEAYKLLAPIPVNQVVINKLNQNPGYN